MLRIGVLGSGGSAGAGGGADAWPVDPLMAGPSRKRTATQSLPLACTTPTPTRLKRDDMTLSRWAGAFMKAWWRRVAWKPPPSFPPALDHGGSTAVATAGRFGSWHSGGCPVNTDHPPVARRGERRADT